MWVFFLLRGLLKKYIKYIYKRIKIKKKRFYYVSYYRKQYSDGPLHW